MPVQLERRIVLPPDTRSPGRARRMLTDALEEIDAEDVLDAAVLLASELCENAVLHAGTEFEVELLAGPDKVMVTVSDRGAGPLELHLAQPRRRYGRAATHGRGLLMVQRLASAWGTCHETDGTHRVWFALARGEASPAQPVPGPPDADRVRSLADRARRLLNLPDGLADRMQPGELVAELVRRLRDALDAELVLVEVDEGDGAGARELTRAGAPQPTPGIATEVRLPTTAPLRGILRVLGTFGTDTAAGADGLTGSDARDLVELVAHRIAMAVEAQWLRSVDRHRRGWLTYLADTSELLGQTLDVDLAVAVVPQVVVPRLGLWSAVHMLDDSGRLTLAALTHADENELPELREALDPARPGDLQARLHELVRRRSAGPAPAPARFAVPTEGVAVALHARGTTIGTLSVGRPADRPHSPEDVVLVGDIARRAGLAIHNAQSTAAHVAVSQALQQALLPRALPVVPGVDFAADYVTASTGTDIGGDFYDVLTIDPARWLVSVGDVCGKGARAAARTGQVRDVLRVLVRDGSSLHRAVDLLNDVMMEAADPLQFSTLAAALVGRARRGQPPGLHVELVLAGHLQPVLVRAGGAAELVGAFGTAVGLVERVTVECTRHHLAPGDTLLLYTDGVTERRRGHEQFGPERLLDAAGSAPGGTAAQLVTAVRAAVERFSGEQHDDIALLAVRAGTSPSGS
ncbi:MAG: SpoIIE family protein phosphatase [Pseudonocardia sp.]